jgi:uncharacterized protein YcsI (UPF0317 family)
MTNTPENVRIGVTGGISKAAFGVAAPTSGTETLGGSWTSLGYIHADGVEAAIDKSENAIYAWQNSEQVRTSITEASLTFTFKMIETSVAVLEAYYGGTVDTLTGKIEVVPSATTKGQFVIDVLDDETAIRYYLPNAEITQVEAITFANGEPVSYGVTVKAYAVDGRSADLWVSSLIAD